MYEHLLPWYAIWAGLLAAFLAILHRSGERKLYLAYFLFGAAFGFYFDYVSFSSGYYSYPFYYDAVLGLPFTMTLAEGFSVAITMRVFETILNRFGKSRKPRRRKRPTVS